MYKCSLFLFRLDKEYVMQASFGWQEYLENVDLMNEC
jgi:hypothetical protein